MNDLLLLLVEVRESLEDLRDDAPGLSVRQLVLELEVHVEVAPLAVLEHGAERVGVDREHVVQLDDARVQKRLVDVVLYRQAGEHHTGERQGEHSHADSSTHAHHLSFLADLWSHVSCS